MAEKTKNQRTSDFGENVVCKYLVRNGYKILFRNYYEKLDEIDIIARSFDRTLIFVKVKTLKEFNSLNLKPEDNLTKDKFKKLSRACRIFARSHPELLDENKGWRIDLVAVTMNDPDENVSANHYENIYF
jgi:putative endonuclease